MVDRFAAGRDVTFRGPCTWAGARAFDAARTALRNIISPGALLRNQCRRSFQGDAGSGKKSIRLRMQKGHIKRTGRLDFTGAISRGQLTRCRFLSPLSEPFNDDDDDGAARRARLLWPPFGRSLLMTPLADRRVRRSAECKQRENGRRISLPAEKNPLAQKGAHLTVNMAINDPTQRSLAGCASRKEPSPLPRPVSLYPARLPRFARVRRARTPRRRYRSTEAPFVL